METNVLWNDYHSLREFRFLYAGNCIKWILLRRRFYESKMGNRDSVRFVWRTGSVYKYRQPYQYVRLKRVSSKNNNKNKQTNLISYVVVVFDGVLFISPILKRFLMFWKKKLVDGIFLLFEHTVLIFRVLRCFQRNHNEAFVSVKTIECKTDINTYYCCCNLIILSFCSKIIIIQIVYDDDFVASIY